jgi:dihydroorotate dehydrogenase
LRAAIKKYARRWADSQLPIIVHLMADTPEETAHMVQFLEELENIVGVELGFPPLLSDDFILSTVEACLGELPIIVNLPSEQALIRGPRVVNEGAAAISLATPRGILNTDDGQLATGRLSGPALFPPALLTVRDAVQTNIPIIGAGGVGSKENADAMLLVGALAVQMDSSLWKGDFRLSVPES